MEDAVNDTVNCTIGINAFIIPTRNELRDNPFENLRSDSTSAFVEDLKSMLVSMMVVEWLLYAFVKFGAKGIIRSKERRPCG